MWHFGGLGLPGALLTMAGVIGIGVMEGIAIGVLSFADPWCCANAGIPRRTPSWERWGQTNSDDSAQHVDAAPVPGVVVVPLLRAALFSSTAISSAAGSSIFIAARPDGLYGLVIDGAAVNNVDLAACEMLADIQRDLGDRGNQAGARRGCAAGFVSSWRVAGQRPRRTTACSSEASPPLFAPGESRRCRTRVTALAAPQRAPCAARITACYRHRLQRASPGEKRNLEAPGGAAARVPETRSLGPRLGQLYDGETQARADHRHDGAHGVEFEVAVLLLRPGIQDSAPRGGRRWCCDRSGSIHGAWNSATRSVSGSSGGTISDSSQVISRCQCRREEPPDSG